MSDKSKDDDWGMTMPDMRLKNEKNADGFTDEYASFKNSAPASPPVDDWGMAAPNLDLPANQRDSQLSSDFDKTTPNINIPNDFRQNDYPTPAAPSSADDWGISAPDINIPQPENRRDDWEMKPPKSDASQHITLQPAEKKRDDWEMKPPESVAPPPLNNQNDWGMSIPSVNIPREKKANDWSMPTPVFRKSEGEKLDEPTRRTAFFNLRDLEKSDQRESIGSSDFDKTTPNFNFSENAPPSENYPESPADLPLLPVSESFQTVAPPSEIAKSSAKSGSSKIIYILGGLCVMFLFGAIFLGALYFVFLRSPETASRVEPATTQTNEPFETSAPIAPTVSKDTNDLPKTIEYKGAMMLVPAGEFSMGSDADADESKPAHNVELPAYYIDKTEVTNAEYKAFCDAAGKKYPPNPHFEKDYFLSRPNAPVVGVSFADAKSYADWAGKRLPTEEEWEKAASWDAATNKKREFPWGNAFQKNDAAFGTGKISDVGKFPAGASPVGALDMAGNVLEWVDAYFQPYPGSPSKNAEFGEKNRVARGGHFGSKSTDSLKTTKRIYVLPTIASGEDDEKLVAAVIGFRCAVSADNSHVADALKTQGK